MRVPVNGISLYYEIDGTEGKPWLTFSNSLCATVRMWDEQVEVLKDDFRILRYDTRGHGRTEPAAGKYSLPQLAEDLLDLWDALKIEKSHFVGLSLGGFTAWPLAAKAPDRLLSLAICDSRADCPDAYQEFWSGRIELVTNEGMEAIVQPTAERWFTEDALKNQPDTIEEVKGMIRDTSANGYIGCAHAILGLDYLETLKDISVPTIFIVGSQDHATPPEASKDMQSRIAGSQYVEIDPGSHLSNMENPADFNKALTGFLTGL